MMPKGLSAGRLIVAQASADFLNSMRRLIAWKWMHNMSLMPKAWDLHTLGPGADCDGFSSNGNTRHNCPIKHPNLWEQLDFCSQNGIMPGQEICNPEGKFSL